MTGAVVNANPDVVIFFVEGFSDSAVLAAAAQPLVDIISTRSVHPVHCRYRASMTPRVWRWSTTGKSTQELLTTPQAQRFRTPRQVRLGPLVSPVMPRVMTSRRRP